jgi:phosphoenolpyruvate-protein kinase (PTS system EI component)
MHPTAIPDVRDCLRELNRKTLRGKVAKFLHASDRQTLRHLLES